MNKPHILFVCGRHRWRSPTAEAIYRGDPRVKIRSAGVSSKSPHQVSGKDLEWADLVLVMERKYKSRILETFRDHVNLPRIVSLDIPDEYERMDEQLIALIQKATEFHLKEMFGLEPAAAPHGDSASTDGTSEGSVGRRHR